MLTRATAKGPPDTSERRPGDHEELRNDAFGARWKIAAAQHWLPSLPS
jgi:hypothetical protein